MRNTEHLSIYDLEMESGILAKPSPPGICESCKASDQHSLAALLHLTSLKVFHVLQHRKDVDLSEEMHQINKRITSLCDEAMMLLSFQEKF